MPAEIDKVFKALADQSRRYLLDRLYEHNGQTLGELCEHLQMARQSVTQHLAVLEAANLISTVWRGREKLHYLNPVPVYEIQERWIDKFSLMETGHVLPQAPWEMHAELRVAQMAQNDPR